MGAFACLVVKAHGLDHGEIFVKTWELPLVAPTNTGAGPG